jgi:hypothetical protein
MMSWVGDFCRSLRLQLRTFSIVYGTGGSWAVRLLSGIDNNFFEPNVLIGEDL